MIVFNIGGVGERECVSGLTSSIRLLLFDCSLLLISLDGECAWFCVVDDPDELWREWESDDDRDWRLFDDFCCGRTIIKRRDVGRLR